MRVRSEPAARSTQAPPARNRLARGWLRTIRVTPLCRRVRDHEIVTDREMPANLRDLAYNQMKLRYIEARTHRGERFGAGADRSARSPEPAPVARYGALPAADLLRRIDTLPDADVRAVRTYERRHRHRSTVLRGIERRLARRR